MVHKLKGRTVIDKVLTANQGTQLVQGKEFRITNPDGNAYIIIVSALSGGTQTSEIYFSNGDSTGDRFAISSDGTGALYGYAKAVGGSFRITERWGYGGKVFLPGDAAQTLTLTSSKTTSSANRSQVIYDAPITTDRAVTLSTSDAYAGLTYKIARLTAATGAFKVNVGTGPLAALDPGEWCEVTYNGTAFVLTAKGTGV